MASGPVMVAHRGRTGFEGLTGHLDGLPDRSVTLSSMSLPFLASVPVVDVTPDLVLLIPVTLLDLAFELVAAAVDHVQVVIGELAPLLFDVALELLPVPFNPVPIHHRLLTPSPLTRHLGCQQTRWASVSIWQNGGSGTAPSRRARSYGASSSIRCARPALQCREHPKLDPASPGT